METVLNDKKKGIDFIGITCCFLCHDGQGNVLMTKRSQNCRDEQGTWADGSGSMEFGETVEQTLRRELAEELTTDVIDIIKLGYTEIHRTKPDGTVTHWIAFEHLVEVDRSKVTIGEPEFTDELLWCKFSELPSPLHSAIPGFIEKYGEQVKNYLNK